MRRLFLAGEELSKGNVKIIDVAMKYGYDTPESFSRAFTRFHGIGVEYDGRHVDDDLELVTIPTHTYAVFTGKGKMPDAFVETYHRIVTEFFPQSTRYAYAQNIEFEVYSSADTSNPNYQCEIWIAISEKNA